MLGLAIAMIASYFLVFTFGWVLRGEVEKQKQQKLSESRAKWTTYDRQGRIK